MSTIFKPILEKLNKGENLTVDETTNVMECIASGKADPVQTGAFLVLLHAKGETAEEIYALAKVMREHSTKVSVQGKALEIVGTGGDGHDTINISTSAAIVLASMGVTVAKHGNRSVSSKSGSADVLEKLGVPMLQADCIEECIEQAGIAFMIAPFFHPAMKHVVPVRKALGVKTVFNILGPLLNPAGVRHLMLGVYSPKLLNVYANALLQLGVEHAFVVNSNGLDELAPVGNVQILEVTPSGVKEYRFDLDEVGIPPCEIADLKGGDAEYNAMRLREIFAGGENAKNAIAHTIALNAGAGLYVYGSAPSLAQGYKDAYAHIESGKVLPTLNKWSEVATKLSNKKLKQ